MPVNRKFSVLQASPTPNPSLTPTPTPNPTPSPSPNPNRTFSVLQAVLQSCNLRMKHYFKSHPELVDIDDPHPNPNPNPYPQP